MKERKSLIAGLKPPSSTRERDLSIINKISKSEKVSKMPKGKTMLSLIEDIKLQTNKHLKQFADKVEVCRDLDKLKSYIDKAIEVGEIGIDTETTGLDYFVDYIIGTCLYVPGEKAIYIPHKHKSYVTGLELERQISYEDMHIQMQRIVDAKVDTIFHNAKFDMHMIDRYFKVKIIPYWDTMIAAKLLNNLEQANLKKQYNLHVSHSDNDYSFSELYDGINNELIPLDIFTLYAATDPLITYELYKYQVEEFKYKPGPWKVFDEIEMPLIPIVAKIEDDGVCIDLNRIDELGVKYHKMLEEARAAVLEEVNTTYGRLINSYKIKTPNSKLEEPINLDSPQQLAILLYDIIGVVQPLNKKGARSTDKEVLEAINLPLTKLLLKYKELSTLISSFIDKMPLMTKPDGKIHSTYNQVKSESKGKDKEAGADTGRFSCTDPNLQQIPSHNKEIRTMFVASEGYALIGSDFSKQEPALLSYYSQDKNMLKAWEENKDIYSVIASLSFHKPYEECLEFYPEGTKITVKGKEVICGNKTHVNKAGKELRSRAKPIVLGIMYGRGANSVAEQLGCSKKEAQDIINDFYKSFPNIKPWMDETVNFAKKNGYVETFYGRRRYIKNIQLPEYEFSYAQSRPQNFNPLDFEDEEENFEVSDDLKVYYTEKMNKAFGFQNKERVKMEALRDGVKIVDNSKYVADAVRQCVNSRIQGGAADQSKLAMINIANCKELMGLGFRLLICVHDELIGEAPIENAKRCGELLSECMRNAAVDILKLKLTCDVDITKCWYGEELDVG